MKETIMTIIGSMMAGGVITRLLDTLFMTKKDKTQTEILLIQELQKQMLSLSKRQDELAGEIDIWKEKYYKLLQDHTSLQQKYITLKAEFDRFKQKVKQNFQGGDK